MSISASVRSLICRNLGMGLGLVSRRNQTARILSFQAHSMSSTSASPLKNSSEVNQLALKLGRLNHVAIATPNLEQATAMYRDVLGAAVSPPEDLPEHGVTTVFVNLGNTKIELLHPLGEKSPIQNFLDKNKAGGIHHICIEVDDIYKAVESLKSSGKIRILDPKPKIGAHGKPVVFLHPKDCGGVLMELEQA